MQIQARAKINLTLEILGKREDGYHELRSLVTPIPLADTIAIEPAAEISVSGCPGVPEEKNLAYKAAKLMQRLANRTDGAAIRIEKRIPAGGGLGGGSADAAAVMRALNEMWGLNLPTAELAAHGAEIGSDVPVLVWNCTALMEGRGERVTPMPDYPVPDLSKLVLEFPPVAASTPRVYGEFRMDDRGLGKNDLQPAACRLYPEIAAAIAKMQRDGLRGVMMSGSGSTVFGWRE